LEATDECRGFLDVAKVGDATETLTDELNKTQKYRGKKSAGAGIHCNNPLSLSNLLSKNRAK
jgi:hypothetical protein